MFDLTPSDYWFVTEASKEILSKKYDEYGDHRTEETDLKTTRKVISNIAKSLVEKEKNGPLEDIQKIKDSVNNDLFSTEKQQRKIEKHYFLKGSKVAFRGDFDNNILKEKI